MRATGKRYRKDRGRNLLLAGLLVTAVAVIMGATLLAGRGSSTGSDPGNEEIITGAGEYSEETPLCHLLENSQEEGRPSFETLAFPAQPPVPPRVIELPVLMFHHVGETPPGADEIRAGLTVSTTDFEAMMAYLKQAGYQPVSQAHLFKALFMGGLLPPNPVMLTFDDGYLDNYTVAVPVLEKYGFPATFYVISDRMGSGEYMTWDQVAGLERKGMDVGSHTLSHPDLTTLGASDLEHELAGSAQTISSHLGHPVYWLCYPAGKYDADVTRYAREAGYLLAVTTEPGEQQSSDAPYALMRYRVRADTGVEGFMELVK